MLRLHHSNRAEILAGVLAEHIRAAPGDPMEAERIVVAHRSMARWLTLELAGSLGIAANLHCELPADFAWSIMRGAVPGIGGERAYAPARLRWHIYDALPAFAEERGEPSVASVRAYLAGGGARERFELADRLARVFDRCLLYRPDWIREWARSPPPHWQARLWRRLVDAESERDPERPAGHWVASIDAFRRALAKDGPPQGWPRRVSFFAVPSLSPSYLEALGAASEWLDLHVYVLNPCREYWGDIHSQRESRIRSPDTDPAERYFSTGNELLAAWGRAGRDMIDAFVDAEAAAGAESTEHFLPPEGQSRLARVQRDILDLRLAGEAARGREGAASMSRPHPSGPGNGPGAEAEEDAAIQIHVCHSAIREAEVLHDRLLGLFDSHPDLQPADVLVLVPDLGRYGPAIGAVFGASGRIPFHVARVRESDSPATGALLDLLALPDSRYPAEAVLAPLRAPALRARFGLAESDLPVIRAWVRAAGIRWGVDAAHRGSEHLPETVDHTWRQGLRRLLLGYAAADGKDLVAGLVPCPVEGVAGFEAGPDEHEVLGRFLSYCEAAFELRALAAAGERSAAAWFESLRRTVARFFAAEAPESAAGTAFSSSAREVESVHELIRGLDDETGPHGARVPFEVVRDVLRERADETSAEPARLADGVTIARLAPGAVFPAEVVCVAGLSDGEFPRSPRAPTFDLVAAGPARRGDRDPRHEDRLAFLEALLAARRAFVLLYTGRGLRDDAPSPPSVVVDELVDYLAQRFPGARFETRHPLQPFSPRYFAAAGEADPEERGGVFSYSEGMCRAAQALVATPAAEAPAARFDAILPHPEASSPRVALSELASFFAHPVRWFLRERLGLRLEGEEPTLDEDEPFELDGLDRYVLRTSLWEWMRAGKEAGPAEELLRGSGRLPQRNLGRVTHADAWEDMQGLREALAPHRPALDAPPVAIDLEIAGLRIEGEVRGAGPEGLLWWRIGSLRARDRIEVRLAQLALTASGQDPEPSIAISRESKRWKNTAFVAPKAAEEELSRWIEAWRRGQRRPLPFFPETSWAYAQTYAKVMARKGEEARKEKEARKQAHAKAETAWSSTPFAHGEVEDPYLSLMYGDETPLAEEGFRELAIALLAPLAGA